MRLYNNLAHIHKIIYTSETLDSRTMLVNFTMYNHMSITTYNHMSKQQAR